MHWALTGAHLTPLASTAGGSALVPLAWIVVGYGAFVGIAGGIGAALRAPRPRWLDQFGWVLEVLCVVMAGAAVAWLTQGHHPSSKETFLGYTAASIVVMPVALGSVREDRSSWSSGVVAVAALGTAVVAWRLTVVR